MSTPAEDALAKKRFLALNLIRIFAVLMVLVGLLFALDKVAIPQPPRHLIGMLLIVIGLLDFFFVPGLIAKRWRSPGA
jgi:xanthosine utilization system XapX-like protein